MTKLDPIIAVKNVERCAIWYRQIFGFKNIHSGKGFAVLATGNEEIILCLTNEKPLNWRNINH